MQWHEIFKELKLAYEKNARWPEISKSFATTNLLQEEFALVDTAGKGTADAQGLITVLGRLGLEMQSEVIEDTPIPRCGYTMTLEGGICSKPSNIWIHIYSLR